MVRDNFISITTNYGNCAVVLGAEGIDIGIMGRLRCIIVL